MQVDGPPRGMGRLNRVWMEVVKLDMKKCDLFVNLTQDRLEWRNIIHVANDDDDNDDIKFPKEDKNLK